MKNIFSYNQKLQGKKINKWSTCDINVFLEKKHIHIQSKFHFISKNKDNDKEINEISIDLEKGDFSLTSSLVHTANENNFKKLDRIINEVLINGLQKPGFWGVKYKKAINELFNIIKDLFLKDKDFKDFKNNYLNNYGSEFFRIIVDFYLYKNNIKSHNNIYLHIIQYIPKKKYLKSNDNKYLPALLDNLGIKTKYFISILSSNSENNINFNALKFLCNLFGNNFIDFIKEFDWLTICKIDFYETIKYECENIHEKRNLIKIINNAISIGKMYSIIYEIQRIVTIKSILKTKNFNPIINVTIYKELKNLYEDWVILKKNLKKGYILKHKISDDIVNKFEKPITYHGNTFIPKMLLSEDDFTIEGMRMKNCLGDQFRQAAINMFFSLSHGKKKINLQFRKGELVQAYGKSNSPYPKEFFGKPIKILNNRILEYKDLTWSSEKIIL